LALAEAPVPTVVVGCNPAETDWAPVLEDSSETRA